MTADGEQIAEVVAEFAADPFQADDQLPGEAAGVNVALPMPTVGLPGPGAYSFEILIDGVHQASVPFSVGPPPVQPEGAP
ncbi:MAG: hypothetical protein WD271_15155 [Acidimicrobiia bacterium]